MKNIFLLPAAVLLLLAFSSCIKEEALNAECDITAVDEDWLEANSDIIIGTPVVANDYVFFSIQKGSDRSALDPSFSVTEGATLTMTDETGAEVEANGVTRDFSSPQTYTTHSQDGNWSKDYSVSFNYPILIEQLSFENYELDTSGRYHVWYEIDSDDTNNPRRDYWASGNAGYALTGIGDSPTDYPSAANADGVSGNCLRLITRDTGSFGESANMPIAAGNIFIGEFKAAQAMLFPRLATRFGFQLVTGKPLTLEGWYKYTPGETFTDKNDVVDLTRRDTADIYCVVFEVDPDDFEPLNGDDILSSERIVLLARIADPGEPSDWTFFSEPFEEMNGKEFSEERLRNDGYAISVVATSSRQGAYFEGAIGSELWVDEIRIIWEGEENDDD